MALQSKPGKKSFCAGKRMKTKLQLVLAITGACLTTGCIVDPSYYPPRARVVEDPYYPPPGPPVEYVVPELIVVEHGVRHDHFFYERHPEFYWRDRQRYPDRFVHLPPPRRPLPPPQAYRGPSRGPAPTAIQGRPSSNPQAVPQQPPSQDSHKKKKDHDRDHDRDQDNR